jgi:hypothetical protein
MSDANTALKQQYLDNRPDSRPCPYCEDGHVDRNTDETPTCNDCYTALDGTFHPPDPQGSDGRDHTHDGGDADSDGDGSEGDGGDTDDADDGSDSTDTDGDGSDTHDGGDGVHVPRVRGPDYRRGRYEYSGYVRLVGGYTFAYFADEDGDRQYTLDTYDDITTGLWTPHQRAIGG